MNKFRVVHIKIRYGERRGKVPLIQQVAGNASVPEDAKAMAGFWMQEGHFLISLLKAQYVLDTVLMWRLLILKLLFSSTSIRPGQESQRIYLNEPGKRSPHGEKKALKKDCYTTTPLCQSMLLLTTEATSQGLLTFVWLKNKGIKFHH